MEPPLWTPSQEEVRGFKKRSSPPERRILVEKAAAALLGRRREEVRPKQRKRDILRPPRRKKLRRRRMKEVSRKRNFSATSERWIVFRAIKSTKGTNVPIAMSLVGVGSVVATYAP